MLIALCVVAAAEIWLGVRLGSRAAPPGPKTPLDAFRAEIDGMYHDCVPLGWYPERLPSGRSYPRLNLDVARDDGPFQALWVAIVPHGAKRDARAASVKRVLDELTGAGLLEHADDPRGDRYNVTKYGERFYYDDDALSGNVEFWPYLCYSRVRVTSIAWDRRHPDVPGPARSVAKRVRVWWRTETVGAWASPLVRAHSVALNPRASPADATICRYVDGEWLLRSLAPDRARPAPC